VPAMTERKRPSDTTGAAAYADVRAHSVRIAGRGLARGVGTAARMRAAQGSCLRASAGLQIADPTGVRVEARPAWVAMEGGLHRPVFGLARCHAWKGAPTANLQQIVSIGIVLVCRHVLIRSTDFSCVDDLGKKRSCKKPLISFHSFQSSAVGLKARVLCPSTDDKDARARSTRPKKKEEAL
jgi:hypothetical protein